MESKIANLFRSLGFSCRDMDGEVSKLRKSNKWLENFREPLGKNIIGIENAVDVYLELGEFRLPIQIKTSVDMALKHSQTQISQNQDRVPMLLVAPGEAHSLNPVEIIKSLLKDGVWISPTFQKESPGTVDKIRSNMKPLSVIEDAKITQVETVSDLNDARIVKYAQHQFRRPKWLLELINQRFIVKYCEASERTIREILTSIPDAVRSNISGQLSVG